MTSLPPIEGTLSPSHAQADSVATTVQTVMTFPAGAQAVWKELMFYEQVEERPSFLLRLLLPVPIRTVGRKSEVGDEATCLYEGGQLIKRVTQTEAGREYRFEVIEQALAVGRGVRLSGGAYTLREVAEGTEVTAMTRYLSPRRPRWLWKPIEATVCHAFHRHILGAMRHKLPAA